MHLRILSLLQPEQQELFSVWGYLLKVSAFRTETRSCPGDTLLRGHHGWALLFQFSSVQSLSHVPSLCDSTDCSTPGFPLLHCLPEFTQTHVHRVDHAIQHLILCCPFSSCPQSFLALGSFPKSQLFASRDQRTEASASASVLLMNTQD